jgi:cyanate permease
MLAIFYVPTKTVLLPCIALGMAQGSALALTMLYIVWHSSTPTSAATLSAISQGMGYLIAVPGSLAMSGLFTFGDNEARYFLATFIGIATMQLLVSLWIADSKTKGPHANAVPPKSSS